jgi:DivIVA domain-containing protein
VGLIAVALVVLLIVVGGALVLMMPSDGLSQEPVDHIDLGVPDRPLTADDIAGLRFRTGLRGYRMEDVDAALDRLAEALRAAQRSPDR